MDKIDTSLITDPNIQQPFLGDSLGFLQDGFKEAISSYLGMMHGKSTLAYCLLQGCVNSVAAPDANTTGGFISVLISTDVWEVFWIPPTVLTADPGEVAVLNYDTATFAAFDPVEFSDGVTRSVHQVRRMKIESAVSGTGLIDLSDLEAKRVGLPWDIATFYTSSSDYLYFRKDFDNYVNIQGMLNYANARTLPVGYRPITAITFTAPLSISANGAVFGYITVTVNTNGTFTMSPALASGGTNFEAVNVNFAFKVAQV